MYENPYKSPASEIDNRERPSLEARLRRFIAILLICFAFGMVLSTVGPLMGLFTMRRPASIPFAEIAVSVLSGSATTLMFWLGRRVWREAATLPTKKTSA